MKTVLVVTNRDDIHASAVIEALHALDCPVFRLNTEELLDQYSVGLFQGAGGDQLLLRSLEHPRQLAGEDIGAVYYRRPAVPEAPAEVVDEDARRIVVSESRHFLKWLYAYLSDRWWFADPFTLDRMQSKPWQIKQARTAGLRVPDTFYGNLPDLAEALRPSERLAVKSIREMGFVDGERYRAFYTAMVDAADLLEDREALSINSNFFQAALEKKHELRITYVDGELFCVRIDSQQGPEEAHDDWRRVWWDELEHEQIQLPEDVAGGLSSFMAAVGLRFGAIDMIVTPDDEHVFLECNANGQWLWLDELTGAGIGDAIARSLARACRD